MSGGGERDPSHSYDIIKSDILSFHCSCSVERRERGIKRTFSFSVIIVECSVQTSRIVRSKGQLNSCNLL
jgi:hypothetical protein